MRMDVDQETTSGKRWKHDKFQASGGGSARRSQVTRVQVTNLALGVTNKDINVSLSLYSFFVALWRVLLLFTIVYWKIVCFRNISLYFDCLHHPPPSLLLWNARRFRSSPFVSGPFL
jgi:hypothetical protein